MKQVVNLNISFIETLKKAFVPSLVTQNLPSWEADSTGSCCRGASKEHLKKNYYAFG